MKMFKEFANNGHSIFDMEQGQFFSHFFGIVPWSVLSRKLCQGSLTVHSPHRSNASRSIGIWLACRICVLIFPCEKTASPEVKTLSADAVQPPTRLRRMAAPASFLL